MLQHSADRARGSLRPQGDRAPALILKGVHLFLHHIGSFTHAALKELGVLKNRRTDFAKAVNGRLTAQHILYKPPLCRVARQRVLSALRGLCQ